MKITDVALVRVSGESSADEPRSRERSAKPLDVHVDLSQGRGSPPRQSGPAQHSANFVEVRTDDGVTGIFGPVDGPHAPLLKGELRDFVLGMDPLASELVWDALLRRNRHGRSGYYMMAVSALDCALWDLKGKALGQPVYRLLGGPTRQRVPAYASMLGFSLEPQELSRQVRARLEQGYRAQKWFFRYGPADGPEGVERNVEMARVAREAMGDQSDLMLDAFNSWDANYAIAIGRRIADCRPRWLEEPVPCDRTDALRRIRQSTGIPIATGEHLYTRWQVKTLLDAGAVDYIQADPDWCGGISELVKIVHLCSAYDVPVCPHGHSLHAALHVAAATSPAEMPMVEFLSLHQRNKQRFLAGYLHPEEGFITAPDRPGLGIEIDESKVARREEV